MSAAFGPSRWQLLAALLAVAASGFTIVLRPESALTSVLLAFVLPFCCVVAVRLRVLLNVPPAAGPRQPPATPLSNEDLPTYTVLVALYGEQRVVPQLVKALTKIDYPIDKLEILLVVEARDDATRRALASAPLPPRMRVVVVPPGHPRTKPRALNYALQEATGDFVVIFDAEDEPDRDQLRRAAAAFAAADDKLGCLQAALRIHNARSWLTRQFALEYRVLFGLTLPALERLGHPMPLGGTSNHFPRRLLGQAGAWDPYNVTEDADLGIRLARMGYRVATLNSGTWEEAPATLGAWLNQRTRWQKGWMQTLIVHTRRPWALLRELGSGRSFAFVALMGSMVLSPLVHPVFIAYAGYRLAVGGQEMASELDLIWLLAATNFILGYATGITLAFIAALRTGEPGLVLSIIWLPVYWLLMSIASYRALLELVRRPHHWHKTPHAGRSRNRRRLLKAAS